MGLRLEQGGLALLAGGEAERFGLRYWGWGWGGGVRLGLGLGLGLELECVEFAELAEELHR